MCFWGDLDGGVSAGWGYALSVFFGVIWMAVWAWGRGYALSVFWKQLGWWCGRRLGVC